MDYIFTFLEGIASFISPCILPMLPIYLSYLMGSGNKKEEKEVEKITTEKLDNNININFKTKEMKQNCKFTWYYFKLKYNSCKSYTWITNYYTWNKLYGYNTSTF